MKFNLLSILLILVFSIYNQNIIAQKDSCVCKEFNNDFKFIAERSFSPKTYNKDSLSKLSNEEILNTKSIEFAIFDTIPEAFSAFKNIETITLKRIDWNEVTGLDLFPNLKNIKFLGKIVNLENNPKWLKNIEIIHAEKSQFNGLKSFNQLPNLKELKFAFSGFDKFPSDFENLQCLKHFETGAHQGKIDLSKINLKNMPCLQYVKFHSWRKNLTGIPMNIDRIKNHSVHHGNLTEKDRKKY